MTDSPQPEPTTTAGGSATLPRDVTYAPPKVDEQTEYSSFERLIDITARTVRLRSYSNKHIVFVLSFDALQHLASLTKGDDRWEDVG